MTEEEPRGPEISEQEQVKSFYTQRLVEQMGLSGAEAEESYERRKRFVELREKQEGGVYLEKEEREELLLFGKQIIAEETGSDEMFLFVITLKPESAANMQEWHVKHFMKDSSCPTIVYSWLDEISNVGKTGGCDDEFTTQAIDVILETIKRNKQLITGFCKRVGSQKLQEIRNAGVNLDNCSIPLVTEPLSGLSVALGVEKLVEGGQLINALSESIRDKLTAGLIDQCLEEYIHPWILGNRDNPEGAEKQGTTYTIRSTIPIMAGIVSKKIPVSDETRKQLIEKMEFCLRNEYVYDKKWMEDRQKLRRSEDDIIFYQLCGLE